MNKVKEIMEQADGMSRSIFAEYKIGKKELEQAESNMKDFPAGSRDYLIWQGKAIERKKELYEIESRFNTVLSKLQSLRSELALAIEQDNFADPKKIDRDIVYLLDSGILSPAEYKKMYDESAGNPTMQRIIKKRIESLVNDQIGRTDGESMQLRSLLYNMPETRAEEQIGQFDVLINLFERTITNKLMIDQWDEFVNVDGE